MPGRLRVQRWYSMAAMWGSVELEPEVRDWILHLRDTGADRVRFHIDRLSELGPQLDEPHTRQLDGKLRELRFHLEGRQMRITYWIARVDGSSCSRCLRRPSARSDERSSGRSKQWNGVLPRTTALTTRSEDHD